MGFLNNIGTTEILIIAGLLLLLFGSKKITELARGLGESGKEIKKAKRELTKVMDNRDYMEDNPKEKKSESKPASLGASGKEV